MQLAFVIAMLIVVLFVVMSDFSAVNLDENTERLLYVSDADSMGYEYEETEPDEQVADNSSQTVDNSQQSGFSGFTELDNDFIDYDFSSDMKFNEKDIAMDEAEELIDQLYNK